MERMAPRELRMLDELRQLARPSGRFKEVLETLTFLYQRSLFPNETSTGSQVRGGQVWTNFSPSWRKEY